VGAGLSGSGGRAAANGGAVGANGGTRAGADASPGAPVEDGGASGGGATAGNAGASAGAGGEPAGTAGTDGNGDAASPPVEPRGTFVAVGYGGRTLRSVDDGVTWVDDVSLVPTGGDDDKLLRAVVWGRGTFVALGWRVMTSPDGKAWNDHGTTLGQWIGAATFASGEFASVGGYGLHRVSGDGVAWENHDTGTVAFHAHDALAFGDYQGGRFVACGDDGQRSHSSDGKAWTASSGAAGVRSTHVAFGAGVFVAIDGTAVVVSRDGGASFTSGPALPSSISGLVFAASRFTAVGDGHVFTSVSGADWTDHAVAGLTGGMLAYGHGTYVLVSGGGLRRSPDGITFAPVTARGTNALEAVTFGPTG